MIGNDVSIEAVAGVSAAEAMQWGGYLGGMLREWENSFYQYEKGLFTLPEFEARRESWHIVLLDLPYSAAVRVYWSNFRTGFAPSFRAEIDRLVAEAGG